LTEEEKARNVIGVEFLFAGKRHELFELLEEVYGEGKKSEFCHLHDQN
jgi:5'-3' exonuclease